MTTAENYDAVVSGRSAIRQWKDHRGVPGTFVASLFPDGTSPDGGSDGLSLLEAMAVASARRAVADAGITCSDGGTLLVLSTTKGNVEWLDDGTHATERALPTASAAISDRANSCGQRLHLRPFCTYYRQPSAGDGTLRPCCRRRR